MMRNDFPIIGLVVSETGFLFEEYKMRLCTLVPCYHNQLGCRARHPVVVVAAA